MQAKQKPSERHGCSLSVAAKLPNIMAAESPQELITVGPVSVRFLVTADQSNGSLATFELFVAASKSLPAPTHSHDGYEETMYGIEGVLTVTVDGNVIELGPGQAICIPRSAVHRFDNHGEIDAKVLCMVTPALIGPEYFQEVAAVLAEAAGGPPDRVRMIEIMRQHGLTPALALA
jgi:quercetin dioxygenase-like cupin family protein